MVAIVVRERESTRWIPAARIHRFGGARSLKASADAAANTYSPGRERTAATRPDRAGDRAGARGLVRRHARPARHPAAVRRRDPGGRVGPDVVQPRARARGGAGRVRRPPTARAGVRDRDARLRGRVPRMRACAVVRRARRRALRPGGGRRAARLRRARPPLGGRGRRLGRTRRADVGVRRHRRRRARAGGGRDPDRDARLGVHLSRAGAACARDPARLLAAAREAARRAGREAERAGEPRAAPRLGRADGGPVPARAPARGRVAHPAGGGGDRRDDHAGRRDRDLGRRRPLRRPRHACCLRVRPHRRRPDGARRPARVGMVVDDRAADPRRRRSRADALRP